MDPVRVESPEQSPERGPASSAPMPGPGLPVPTVATLLRLQRRVGNRAVARLIHVHRVRDSILSRDPATQARATDVSPPQTTDSPVDKMAGARVSSLLISQTENVVAVKTDRGWVFGSVDTDLADGTYEVALDTARRQWTIKRPSVRSGLRFWVDLVDADPWTLSYPDSFIVTVVPGKLVIDEPDATDAEAADTEAVEEDAKAKLRIAVQMVKPEDIRGQWEKMRGDFVTVASDSANTLGGLQMYQIWLRAWMDKQGQAHAEFDELDKKLRAADPDWYVEKKLLFDKGVSQHGRLGPEYELAYNRRATADYVLSNLRDVHDWLETWVDGAGHHVTLNDVNAKAVEIAKAKGWFQTYMAPLIYGLLSLPRGYSAMGVEPPVDDVPPGTEVATDDIRFSQNKVTEVSELVENMRRNGWKGDPIDVVRMPDGKLTTLDNTRVLAADRVGIKVRANIHAVDEPLPADQVERFTTKKAVPKTWGDAVELRIGKQSAAYRKRNPMGSFATGTDE